MSLKHQQANAPVRRFDYDDRTVIAADFGPAADPSIDLLDGTAIVVYDTDQQAEIDLPEGDVQAFNRNGVVTFEVRK
ncbi:MAG: hypothetical protein SVG88_04250 [Halobacteriales archaeon]|nr:hypothetical protein [Halobacteriales archaeon]